MKKYKRASIRKIKEKNIYGGKYSYSVGVGNVRHTCDSKIEAKKWLEKFKQK